MSRFVIIADGRWTGGTFTTQREAETAAASKEFRAQHPGKEIAVASKSFLPAAPKPEPKAAPAQTQAHGPHITVNIDPHALAGAFVAAMEEATNRRYRDREPDASSSGEADAPPATTAGTPAPAEPKSEPKEPAPPATKKK